MVEQAGQEKLATCNYFLRSASATCGTISSWSWRAEHNEARAHARLELASAKKPLRSRLLLLITTKKTCHGALACLTIRTTSLSL